MTQQAFESRCQFPRHFGRVIDAIDQSPLEGDASSCLLNVVFTGLDHILDLIALVDRHNGETFFVICRVEGDGKVDLSSFVRETPDLRDQPNGRDGEAPRSKVVSFRVVQDDRWLPSYCRNCGMARPCPLKRYSLRASFSSFNIRA